MNFGDRLKKIRKEKEISQEDFAKKIGVSRSSIGNYETNQNMPTAEILDKIADILECSIDYLLGKTDIRNTGKQIDDILNETMIGMSKEDYESLTETQKKQIRDFAIYIKNQNEADKK